MIALADLKAWLGDPEGPGVDTLLTALEARAVSIIEAQTDRYFGASAVRVEILPGTGTTRLWLNEAPATLTTVEERWRAGRAWVAVGETDDDGWELRQPQSETAGAQLLRKNGHAWVAGYEYRITYSFGYTAGQEPAEIRQAVLDLVALKYGERGREGLQSETIGDHSYTVLVDSMGERDLFSVPGLRSTIYRWRHLERQFA